MLAQRRKDGFERSRQKPGRFTGAAHDCISFSTSACSICEQATVSIRHGRLEQILACFIENFILACVICQYYKKAKKYQKTGKT